MKPPCDDAVIRSVGPASPCVDAEKVWVLVATIAASSMAFIDGTVVNVALPALQESFHARVTDMQWVIESYGLFLGSLILVGGSLGDLFGRRLSFLLGVGLFTLASMGCGVSSSVHEMIVARSIQGVGAALLVPGSLAIISSAFDEKSRGQAIGTWSGFTAITTALGPVLGGWLIEYASWRWVFFLNLPLAFVVVGVSLWRIPESRGIVQMRVDWKGALTATLGLGGLVTALIESEERGWGNSYVLASVTVGIVSLAAFLLIEQSEKSSMVPLSLFRSRNFSGANLFTLFLYGAIGIFFFLFPLNLIQVQNYAATTAGIALLPLILLIFLLSRWSGGLVARFGSRAPLVVGSLVAALGFALFALPSVGGGYWRSFFPAILVLGLGMAITVAPLTTVVMNAAEPNRVGTASGINNAVARIASVLAIAVFGIVMVNAFGAQLSHSLDHLSLSTQILHEIQADEINLAAIQPPTSLDPRVHDDVVQSIRGAFVYGFRIVMGLCATLSFASFFVAWFMIPRNPARIRDAGSDRADQR